MIFIVGIDHKIQHDGRGSASPENRKLFASYISEQVTSLDINILVEEMNEEALQMSFAKNCVVRNVAASFGLPHIFCEPGRQDRKSLGVPSASEIAEKAGVKFYAQGSAEQKLISDEEKKYFSIRENFWLDEIREFLGKTILIVVGAAHTETFPLLLKAENIEYETLSANWCLESLA
ncbi:MAG TPA: hypothetical protein VLB83_02255 [Candidatus Paceibacterota bacterium]|nr:hypothetical protein [Candidatus Paceibacterota bacterium]